MASPRTDDVTLSPEYDDVIPHDGVLNRARRRSTLSSLPALALTVAAAPARPGPGPSLPVDFLKPKC